MNKIKDLVESIVEGKGGDAKVIFEAVMAEKASLALEAAKYYVAQNYFGNPEQE